MVKPKNTDLEQEASDLAPDSASSDFVVDLNKQQPGSTTLTGGTGSNVYPYPNRIVNYTKENLEWVNYEQKTSVTNRQILRRPSGIPGLGGNTVVYSGSNLTDENNNIVRVPYSNTGSDVTPEYWSLQTDDERSLLLKTAQRLGYYGDGKPSEGALKGFGLTNNDKSAIQDLLDFSTSRFRTWKAIAGLVNGGVIAIGNLGSGSGRSYSVVSSKDAEQALTEASFRYLGRALTAKEIQAAVQRVQAEERAAAAGNVQDPASLSVAAKGQVERINPAEATAYKVGGAINRIFALLGGS